MDESVGFRAGDQSRVSEPVRSQPAQGPGRKKGTACTRCRSQKIRCDHGRPSCGNCSRAGRPCVRVNLANNPEAISYIAQVESRLRSLEDSLRRVAPEELERAPAVNPAALDERGSYLGQAVGNGRGPLVTPFTVQGMREDSAGAAIDNTLHGALEAAHQEPSPANCNAASASPSASAQIEPSEPLAHEVGLLSLANSKESKYLGPSSGVWFARLIFSAVPHSRGPPTNWAAPGLGAQQTAARAQPFAQDWVPDVDLQNFVDAYFDTYHPLYPFLDEDAVADFLERIFAKSSPALHSMQMPRLSEIEAALSPIHFVQILLIIALGATILETRLSSEFLSERY
ncbi:hypothetical protein TOPH_07119 [Tolypocladium ophioglossoides CBS 100239]|uniref:Zn(2)-C6 fungal-type domain-containing protein n=1 Tax=Tolypocladium ophioglossoides (strain CBS 100239) TaxID=1163406 RepID=A0A0L0N2Q2_TOLOC|nr:hypothetical protein TOPH_07119 [Tolypocladium ophioglossoides CBS 100239]